jgi:hypothetical protein
MLGSWYTPQEIGKRAMIFWLSGSVGTLFSGFLQAAAFTNLNGVNGYAGCTSFPTYSLLFEMLHSFLQPTSPTL